MAATLTLKAKAKTPTGSTVWRTIAKNIPQSMEDDVRNAAPGLVNAYQAISIDSLTGDTNLITDDVDATSVTVNAGTDEWSSKDTLYLDMLSGIDTVRYSIPNCATPPNAQAIRAFGNAIVSAGGADRAVEAYVRSQSDTTVF